MKKTLAVLAAAAMLLTGCSDSGSNTDSSDANQTESYAPPGSDPVAAGEDWVDIKGQQVSAHSSGNDEGQAPAAEALDTQFVDDVRFVFPSLGMDVPYGWINEVDGVLWPTNFTSVFGVRNRGVSYDATDQGTAYLVTHTLSDGWAPGNWFYNGDGSVAFKEGDQFSVGDRQFQVVDSFAQEKTEATHNATLWDDTIPGRLFIIVCSIDGSQNQVIEAKPA